MSPPIPQDLTQRLVALGAARHLLVCSDYDGTLAPIAPRPEQAQLLPGAFDLLHSLAGLAGTRVAIISGRARDNLRTHSGLEQPIILIGSHGAELPGHAAVPDAAEAQAQLDALQAAIARLCVACPGAWIERKPLGLAVHVRQAAPPDAERTLAAVRGEMRGWPGIRVTEGKAVIELSLSRASKADAIRWLRDDWGAGPQVIYLGDDVTDEAAFGALGPADVGVKVGVGATGAQYRVTSELAALNVLTVLWRSRTAQQQRHAP